MKIIKPERDIRMSMPEAGHQGIHKHGFKDKISQMPALLSAGNKCFWKRNVWKMPLFLYTAKWDLQSEIQKVSGKIDWGK